MRGTDKVTVMQLQCLPGCCLLCRAGVKSDGHTGSDARSDSLRFCLAGAPRIAGVAPFRDMPGAITCASLCCSDGTTST
jgi:hypothetical protein